MARKKSKMFGQKQMEKGEQCLDVRAQKDLRPKGGKKGDLGVFK